MCWLERYSPSFTSLGKVVISLPWIMRQIDMLPFVK